MTSHLVLLSCGCQGEYSVLCHPFEGALLFCPSHGDVRSISATKAPDLDIEDQGSVARAFSYGLDVDDD